MGAELGEFVKRARSDAEEVEDLKTANRELHGTLDKTKEELAALKEQLRAYKDLEIREAQAEEAHKTLAYEKQILELRETHARERVEDHKNMFDKVFKNVAVKRNIFDRGNTPIAVPGGHGGVGHVQEHPYSKSYTEETTEE